MTQAKKYNIELENGKYVVKGLLTIWEDVSEVYPIHGICNTIEEAEEHIKNGEKAKEEWLSDLERVIGKLTEQLNQQL